MITNMLDKEVIYNGKECKITAVYQADARIFFVVVDNDDNLKDGVRPSEVKLNNKAIYSVIMYWPPERKIHAIKTVREITGIGLKDAKDLVEANPSGVPIKSGLTHAEAKEIMRVITQNGQEGQIKG